MTTEGIALQTWKTMFCRFGYFPMSSGLPAWRLAVVFIAVRSKDLTHVKSPKSSPDSPILIHGGTNPFTG